MKKKILSLGAGSSLCLAGMYFATLSLAQGVISFEGSIAESSCVPSLHAGGLRLDDCPALARSSAISVQSVDPVGSASAISHSSVVVKLVDESGKKNRYYSQQYKLLDQLGKPVNSGAYLVTMISP